MQKKISDCPKQSYHKIYRNATGNFRIGQSAAGNAAKDLPGDEGVGDKSALNTDRSQRTEDRVEFRSGYRNRRLDSRLGTLRPDVPGGSVPSFMEGGNAVSRRDRNAIFSVALPDSGISPPLPKSKLPKNQKRPCQPISSWQSRFSFFVIPRHFSGGIFTSPRGDFRFTHGDFFFTTGDFYFTTVWYSGR